MPVWYAGNMLVAKRRLSKPIGRLPLRLSYKAKHPEAIGKVQAFQKK